jgi:hypothetical protein
MDPDIDLSAMTDAARRLLDALDDPQRARAWYPRADDAERTRWYYAPTDHGGLRLDDCTAGQRLAALRLLATGLSGDGYNAVVAVMGNELILERAEHWLAHPTWGRVRDPLNYAIAIFGEPDEGTWAWRFAGHHLSLHYTIVDGTLASATPSFFGAEPTEARLPGGGVLRPCGALEDLGRDLVRSLDAVQLDRALIAGQPPPDIVTGNRSRLEDGIWVVGARELWRDPAEFPGLELFGVMEARHRADSDTLPPAVIDALRWRVQPAGLPSSAMRTDQREGLAALVAAYLVRLPDDAAEAELAAVSAVADQLHFAWAGSLEPRRPHYYRVQGPQLLIEYDNSQREANHVHTVWRNPGLDFGGDPLAAHYRHHH